MNFRAKALCLESSRRRRATRENAGFTLLEMVMVMFVLTLLLGAIFSVVRGTVQLADELAIAQTKQARLHGLSRLLERLFGQLPSNAIVRLRNQQLDSRYLYQLVFANAPSPLGASGGTITVLETSENIDGYLQLHLLSMNPEEAVQWEQGEKKVGERLLLLDKIARLEWRFFNPLSQQWEPLWNENTDLNLSGMIHTNSTGGIPLAGQEPNSLDHMRPGLVELQFAIGAEPPQRWVFWSPPLKLSRND